MGAGRWDGMGWGEVSRTGPGTCLFPVPSCRTAQTERWRGLCLVLGASAQVTQHRLGAAGWPTGALCYWVPAMWSWLDGRGARDRLKACKEAVY